MATEEGKTQAKPQRQSVWIPNFGAKGWGIVAICFVFCWFFSFWTAATNVLYGYYGQAYGWDQTSMAFIITLGGWLSLITTYLFGALSRKIGTKEVIVVGCIGCAVGFAILAVCGSAFAGYVAGVLIYYVFSCAFMPIGVGNLGSSWFPTRKGSFMGFATLGMTICTATINPIIVGFRDSAAGVSGFYWMLVAILIVLAIITQLAVKNTPEEAGAYPDNDRSIDRAALEREQADAAEYLKKSTWTTGKVLKTPQTWLVALSGGFPMLVGGGFLTLLVPVTMAYGHDEMFGIILMASMWPIGLLGHYLVGVIDQKFGTKKVAIVDDCILGLGAVLLAVGGASDAVCAVAVGCFFFGISGAANISMSMTTSIFGRYDFPVAWPVVQIITNLLGFAGPYVFALMMSALGAGGSMWGALVLALIGVVLVAVLPYRQIGSKVHGDDDLLQQQA
jgi:OFA family oxalate/formate antiporter-like MFS transporter